MEFNNDNNTVKRTCKNYKIVNQSYLFPAYITSALINSYIYNSQKSTYVLATFTRVTI